jgi:hypothetical protein
MVAVLVERVWKSEDSTCRKKRVEVLITIIQHSLLSSDHLTLTLPVNLGEVSRLPRHYLLVQTALFAARKLAHVGHGMCWRV